uniref:Uncharacterized protein n=1 Tax=Triticum urartu TaxID=4572 RepID=A0A8R7NY96_TRIUA
MLYSGDGFLQIYKFLEQSLQCFCATYDMLHIFLSFLVDRPFELYISM